MKNQFVVSSLILLFLSQGCMTEFPDQEDAGSYRPSADPYESIDQEIDNSDMDADGGDDACPEDPNKTNPGECGCGVPEGECDVFVDTEIDDLCDPNPCEHGVCLEEVNDYTCQCEKGWTGANCDQSIDDCTPDPCVNGTCVDGHDSYTCHCEAGWFGVNCDKDSDNCPNDPYKTEPGECGCGESDEDSDNDGTPDCHDQCPYDPGKTQPGKCGCGESDEDSDNDGTPDCYDQCLYDPGKTQPGKCGCGIPEGSCDIVQVNSNLQVNLNGQWRGVCCRGGEVEVSNEYCRWEESARILKTTDLQFGNYTELDCPENNQNPADCACRVPSETLHGVEADGNRNLRNSLRLPNGGPIYPNSGWETCIDVVNGEVRSRWTTSDCSHWRLVDYY
jgi:hypothetical protein